MDWFTADTHFGHANIMKYCKRPFASVAEMDKTILDNINAVVRPNDRLFHLGDFAFNDLTGYRKAINCKNIVLILGNHDRIDYDCPLFSKVYDIHHLKTNIDDQRQDIVLCHYAMRVWNKSHYGAWQLYGHSHGGLNDDVEALSFDVGVDCHEFKPIDLRRIKDIMDNQKKWVDPRLKWAQEGTLWKPFDHHKPEIRHEETPWDTVTK